MMEKAEMRGESSQDSTGNLDPLMMLSSWFATISEFSMALQYVQSSNYSKKT